MPRLFPKALVVGASSGIGEAIARQLVAEGSKVALVARREAELRRIAGDLGESAHICVHDVADTAAVPLLFERICRDLGGLDLIVYASGVMPEVAPDEYDFAKDAVMIAVNFSGGVAWLNAAAHRFGVAGAGTIVGIGSVAGDRGRAVFPVYAATKAALETYLEALRNRVARKGVAVVTVKPGPIQTAMIAHLGKMPFVIAADEAARAILDAARRGNGTAYIPIVWRPIMAIIRLIPSPLFRRLNI